METLIPTSYTAMIFDCGPRHRRFLIDFTTARAFTFAAQEVEDIGEYMRAWRAKWKRAQRQRARLADNLPPVTNGR